MVCCSLQTTRALNPIPKNIDWEDSKVAPLKDRLEAITDGMRHIPATYHGLPVLRICGLALLAISMVALSWYSNGRLMSFPEYVLSLVHRINWQIVGYGAIALATLTLGAIAVMVKVVREKNRITGETIGALTGDDHWLAAYYQTDKIPDTYFPGYIDTSTLKTDENGKKSGVAFMYAYKPPDQATAVSCTVTFLTPLHASAAMVYHAIRTVVVPFFIAAKIASTPKDVPEGTPTFKWRAIPSEMGNSLWRIVTAPFYGTAIIYAALYSFIDPMNGRKLAAYIEEDWNEITRAEGFWSVRGWQSLWRWEGFIEPIRIRARDIGIPLPDWVPLWKFKAHPVPNERFGKNGFFAAGCWQPIAVIYFENDVMIRKVSLSKAIDSEKGAIYDVFTAQTLIEQYNQAVTELEQIAFQEGESQPA